MPAIPGQDHPKGALRRDQHARTRGSSPDEPAACRCSPHGGTRSQPLGRVGTSADPDARRAGTEAARAAILGPDARVLLAFASDDLDLEAFAAGLGEVAGDVPVVGCSTAGEIGPGGISDSAAVVVAFGGPGFRARTALARDASADLRRAGADVTSAAHPEDGEHRAVILLSDGLAGDQQEVVRGAYSVSGAVIPPRRRVCRRRDEAMGCPYGQGYLLGLPAALEEIAVSLAASDISS